MKNSAVHRSASSLIELDLVPVPCVVTAVADSPNDTKLGTSTNAIQTQRFMASFLDLTRENCKAHTAGLNP